MTYERRPYQSEQLPGSHTVILVMFVRLTKSLYDLGSMYQPSVPSC